MQTTSARAGREPDPTGDETRPRAGTTAVGGRATAYGDVVSDAKTDAVDGRSKRWDAHRADRRSRLINAAIELIGEEGPGVGVQQFADRATMPRSVVYRLFSDRDDLNEQISAQIVGNLMSELGPLLSPEGSAYDATRHAIDVYVRWAKQNPALHRFLGTGSPSNPKLGSRVVVSTRTAIAIQVSALLRAAMPRNANPALVEPLAFGVIGLVDGAVNRWMTHPSDDLDDDDVADIVASSVWAAISDFAARFDVPLDRDTTVRELLG